ncbi:MAG: CDP-diacylglycerol--glycerol-3-phosphate 3-phosphatidyltransferase [Eggerthellaceae bacterium]
MSDVKKISGSEQLMTAANIVTMVRIALIPVLVFIMLAPWVSWLSWENGYLWQPVIAALVFVILSVTDTLDGYLARSRNEVTDFGKFMDPLADKILVASAMLALVETGVLPSWIAIVILAREFIVSGIRMLAATEQVVIAASWYGKAKTAFTMVAITLFIIMNAPVVYENIPLTQGQLVAFSWFIMIIAVVLTIVSMVDYIVKSKHLLGFGDKPAREADTISQETIDSDHLVSKAQAVIENAVAKKLKIATAESCTGGMVAQALTSVPGASDALEGTVVSYSNQVKHQVLGVSQSTLDEFGAVSEQTACEMAAGVRRRLACDAAVSITGIAGPSGGVLGKPVGTVWVGVSTDDGEHAELHHFKGDREQVRIQSAAAALDMLEKAL